MFPGDTIVTGDGRAQIRFTDGSLVSLRPNSQFRIDEYNYPGAPDGTEKGFFSLLKGGYPVWHLLFVSLKLGDLLLELEEFPLVSEFLNFIR